MASEACWRKGGGAGVGLEEEEVVVGGGAGGVRRAMSMGIERRWQAKMVFVRGMYCAEREEERERRRMRAWREGGFSWVE